VGREAVALVVLALAAGGCMGEDGPERLSQAEFRRQANAICKQSQTELNTIPEPAVVSELPSYFGVVLPIARHELDALAELVPPADDEDAFDRMQENGEDTYALARRISAAAEKNDQNEVQTLLGRAQELGAVGDRLARQLGLTECDDSPTGS
jgi:hypothetical protein